MRPCRQMSRFNSCLANVDAIDREINQQARPLHSIITGSTGDPQPAGVARQLTHPRSRRDPARAFCFAQRCPDCGADAACLRGVDIAQSKANAIDVAAIGVVPINRGDSPFRRRGGCWRIRGYLQRWRLHFRGRRRMARGQKKCARGQQHSHRRPGLGASARYRAALVKL